MTQNKSSFYYGSLYHRLFDHKLAEMRRSTIELTPPESTVPDIACGTGLLCAKLAVQKRARVAPNLIIADSAAPLPKNSGRLQIRLAEFLFGRDHWPHFKCFLSVGGIGGVLQECAPDCVVEHRVRFWEDSRN